MFKGHCWFRRALLGAVCVFPASISNGQDDPFDVVDPASPAGAADPAAAAAEAPANEKTAPGAELPVAKEPSDQDFCRCVGESDSTAVARIEKALNSPLRSNGMDFTDTPLEEVVNLLQDEYGIPIQLDEGALEAIGLDSSEGVTVNLHRISLGSALRLLLKTLQLTYIIDEEVLLITTPEEAESHLVTCVYDVRNLVDKPPMPQGAVSWADFDPLVSAITSCISAETWKENGGTDANIRPLEPGLLVISQTHAVHEQIRGLLRAIREMRAKPPTLPAPSAAAGTPSNETITRSYVLQFDQGDDAEEVRSQLRELIVQSLPDEQWDGQLKDGQPVMLAFLADRIILRHKPATHNAVQKLLVDGGVAIPASPFQAGRPLGRGFGGGGFGGQGGRDTSRGSK